MATKKNSSKESGQRKTLTPQDIAAKVIKMRASLLALEQRSYASQLEDAIKNAEIAAAFKKVKASVSGATDIAILAAIGKAAGIKRLEISQKPAVPRAAANVDVSPKAASSKPKSKIAV
jgi:hypothetical protein